MRRAGTAEGVLVPMTIGGVDRGAAAQAGAGVVVGVGTGLDGASGEASARDDALLGAVEADDEGL